MANTYKDKDMPDEIITADQFRDICRKLKIELKETTDPVNNPGMLGISAYVYSPIFKFGKDSVAEFFIQGNGDTPSVQYCNHVEKDDHYCNYIVIDEMLSGCWPVARNADDLELQLRRAIDNIKKIEDETKWPKRQNFTVEVYYDQHKDMRFTRQDLDEEIWHFIDRMGGKLDLVIVNAAGQTYYDRKERQNRLK